MILLLYVLIFYQLSVSYLGNKQYISCIVEAFINYFYNSILLFLFLYAEVLRRQMGLIGWVTGWLRDLFLSL